MPSSLYDHRIIRRPSPDPSTRPIPATSPRHVAPPSNGEMAISRSRGHIQPHDSESARQRSPFQAGVSDYAGLNSHYSASIVTITSAIVTHRTGVVTISGTTLTITARVVTTQMMVVTTPAGLLAVTMATRLNPATCRQTGPVSMRWHVPACATRQPAASLLSPCSRAAPATPSIRRGGRAAR